MRSPPFQDAPRGKIQWKIPEQMHPLLNFHAFAWSSAQIDMLGRSALPGTVEIFIQQVPTPSLLILSPFRKGNKLKGNSASTEPQRSVQARHPLIAVELRSPSCRSRCALENLGLPRPSSFALDLALRIAVSSSRW